LGFFVERGEAHDPLPQRLIAALVTHHNWQRADQSVELVCSCGFDNERDV